MKELAIGLVAGFVVGIVFRDALEMLRDAWNERGRNPVIIKFNGRLTMFWIVIIFALLQIFLGWQNYNTSKSLNTFVACQSRYNQDFGTAFNAVTVASKARDVALYNVLSSVPDDDPSSEESAKFRDALKQYIIKYQDLVKARAENPYPPVPAAVCGPIPKG